MAITEKYFSSNYFDKTLTGAQADQEVLKDILKEKLPAVADHLDYIDIELSTVTFNWFLAIFFEAVPFQVSQFRLIRSIFPVGNWLWLITFRRLPAYVL